ncbi:MAG: two-component regulator propeller domain-containing protein [Halieaceae bacterium]|nr:two-component regulator propeller domain-containing protein [Halieaceae bacterium]
MTKKSNTIVDIRRLLLIITLLLGSTVATAEQAALEPRTALFDHLTVEDGLSQSVVHTIVQDVQGYIWLGTQEGLNRWDGNELRLYEHVHNDPYTVSDNYIWSIMVADDGTLWLGTDAGGLNRYNRENDTFTHFRHAADDATSLSNDRVRVVYQDRLGNIWVGTDGGGLNLLNAESRTFQRFQHDPADPNSLPSDSVLAMLEDRDGNFWIGTSGGGLARMDRDSGRFERFTHDANDPASLSDNSVRAIYQDRDARLWVGTYEGGLNLFDVASGSFQRFQHDPADDRSLSHNRVRAIYQDYNGALWIGTDNGLNEWRPSSGGFARYQHNLADDASLSDSRVTTITQDRGGVLWVGTYVGVNSWNYLSDAFTYFQAEGTALRLSSNIVTSVHESRTGKLWVGTYGGGLNLIDEANGETRIYDTANSILPDDRVMAVHPDQQGQIWLGTRAGGLLKLDPNTEHFTVYAHDQDDTTSISSNAVTSILAERSGIIWVGTYGGGLNRFDTATGRFERFQHDPTDAASLSSNRVLAIYRDRQGTLWIGTENGGLSAMEKGEESFQRFSRDDSNPDSLSSNTAWLITETGDGSLWVGTNGGGLNRWTHEDRRDQRVRFEKIRRSDGLPSDTVQGMVEDSDGRLWVSSNRGLVQYNPTNGQMRYFSRSNGLRSNDFMFSAVHRTRSSRLLFGGIKGLLAFYPNHITVNRHEPDIALTAFDRGGPLATRYSTDENDEELNLDYSNDLITFSFSGLDYSAPTRNRYRYKLEGFDQEWSVPVEYDRATYTNLPAGSYTFRVQASNNDGIWNEKGAAMNLMVVPPPWATAWAYGGYALAILAAILIFTRVNAMKLAHAARKREELEQIVAKRTRELAERNEELLSLNDQLKESSLTDTLTGLRNRRFLEDFIATEVAHARRQAGDMADANNGEALDIAPALSFMMVDLDGFKQINDAHGHAAGDAALLQVRDVLDECCRKSDTIIRWGGDEFLIVSRNTSNRAAEKLAERIRVGLAECQYQLGNGETGRLTGSIGFAVYPFSPIKPDMVTWEQVANIADQCTYIAKQNGRDAWVGIYGTRETNMEDVERIATDLEGLLGERKVGIRTSVYGKLRLTELRKQEQK